jgi:RHS repeat-associated protein
MKILRKLRITAALLALTIGAQASTRITFLHSDASGSPVAATNEAGAVIWRKTYAPYGKASNKDGDNRIGYTGHVEDQNGLIYAGARYYDPTLGRFLSDDPSRFSEANPMSFNRFAYANDNPYKYVDPDGREVSQIFDPNTGTLTTKDLDSGKVTVSGARSGGDLNNVVNVILRGQSLHGEQIEAGTYDILKGPHPSDKGNYRLERTKDSQYGDDKTDANHSNYREHTGERTAGCVLITSNGSATLDAIAKTKTSQANVLIDNADPSKGNQQVDKYGSLTVLPLKKIALKTRFF